MTTDTLENALLILFINCSRAMSKSSRSVFVKNIKKQWKKRTKRNFAKEDEPRQRRFTVMQCDYYRVVRAHIRGVLDVKGLVLNTGTCQQ